MAGDILGPESTGGYIKARDHIGHLVIVTAVHNVIKKYDERRKQEVDNLDIDFHCFNCEGMAAPTRVLIGAPHVASKIRRDGNLTLGYITQLPPKPPNADGAIVLGDPRPEDVPNVSAWWDSVKASVIQGPVSQDPPPAAAAPSSPWGAPAPAPAPAAAAPASSGGAAWGTAPAAESTPAWGTAPPAAAPAAAAAPPSAPTPPAAPPAKPTPDEVRALPIAAVHALISQGIITGDEARYCGHAV